jgi:hypothetical protein
MKSSVGGRREESKMECIFGDTAVGGASMSPEISPSQNGSKSVIIHHQLVFN